MKKWLTQIKQNPMSYLAMMLAMIALLVALQFNWAYTNNFWSDITTRVIAAVLAGGVLTIAYSRLFVAALVKLTGLDAKALLSKASLVHLPLLIPFLAAAFPDKAKVLIVIALGGFSVLVAVLYIIPREKEIKQHMMANASFFLMLFAIAAALGARKIFIPQPSMDTVNWVMPWLNYIKQHGFAAYGDTFTNYAPIYTYMLGIGSLLPLTDLEIIKYISIAFDFMAAWYIYRIIQLRYATGSIMPALAFTSFLFLPTVLINSSFWGQCDIIYVAFSLAALYYLMLADTRRNNLFAMILYAIALSVKLQAMLIAPLFAIAWFKRDVRLTDFLLIPGVYIILMIPCLIAGRDFMDVLLVYFNIVDNNPVLTANSPNVYQLVGDNFIFNTAGVLVAFGVQAILIFTSVWKLKDKPLSLDLTVHLAFLITLTMPFLLPRMHERYFLLAECIAMLFAFYNPRYFYMPLVLGFISFFTYTEFLFAKVFVPFHWLTLAVLALILIVGKTLLHKLDDGNLQ
ncbi:MAG: hypothetical protein ACO1PI_07705 [Bacteroidota bacterium]